MQFACRIWGLRATDLNQGVVYGHETDETTLHPDLATRFDYDAVFGTVLNRFCVQAVIGHPLTVYGIGRPDPGHARHPRHPGLRGAGPVNPGRPRVSSGSSTSSPSPSRCSRWPRWWPPTSPAQAVIDHVDDPRVEKEEHYYRAAHTKLLDLGLVPHLLTSSVIQSILAVADKYKANADAAAILPTVEWRSTASDLVTAGTPGGDQSAPSRQPASEPTLADR